jgi:Coenzyme PQQ synthesis protein D (PqqD)
MNGKRYVARGPQVAARMLGDEMMVMCARTSTLFTLDDVAAAVWEAADGITPLDEIVSRKICTQYDVSAEVAQRDLENLVEQLSSHGILLLSDEPINPSGSPLKEIR